MIVCADWKLALESTAEELRIAAGVADPPVDAVDVARKLGMIVALDRHLGGRGMYKRLSGQPSIFVRPDDRPERMQWAVAHEIGEAFAYRAAERLDVPEDELTPALREETANLLASRLLLPRRWFFEDVRRFNADLPALKEIYRTASHEAIAWRMLDLDEPTIITIFDQGRVTRRSSNSGFSPPALKHCERHCWHEAHESRRSSRQEEQGLAVQCWPVHEQGWKREVLRTTLLDAETAYDG